MLNKYDTFKKFTKNQTMKKITFEIVKILLGNIFDDEELISIYIKKNEFAKKIKNLYLNKKF